MYMIMCHRDDEFCSCHRGDQVCARSDYLERSTHTILQLKEENAQLREELERMKMSGERQWQTIS